MSLLFPAFLAGLAALFLPWLLHRFSRREAPEKPFPSRRLLESTDEPVARREEIRHRLLLALRALLILLLCLLFAEPWFRSGTATLDTHTIVAVDTSLSMRAGERWAFARQKLDELLAAGDGRNLELVAFDNEVRELAPLGSTPATLRAAVDALEPSLAGNDPDRLFRWLRQRSASSSALVTVHVISDLPANALPDNEQNLALPDVAALELHRPDKPLLNVAVSAEAFTADQATARIAVSLSASRSNDAGAPASTELPVRIVVSHGARELASATSTVSLAAPSSYLFDEVVLPAEATESLQISITPVDEWPGEDALAEDNSVEVLLREAAPDAVSLLSASAFAPAAVVFVDSALASDDRAALQPAAGKARTPLSIASTDLGELSLSDEVTATLQDGNTVLLVDSASSELDAGTAGQASTDIEGEPLGLIDRSHPLSLSGIDWRGTRFHHERRLPLEADDRVLLQTRAGVPILIERQRESGHLLILNDRLDGVDSNLPFEPAFVALVQRVLDWADRESGIRDEWLVGETMKLARGNRLFDAAGEPLTGLGAGRVAPEAFTEPGRYTLLGNDGETPLVVILDPAESDLRPADAAMLTRWQQNPGMSVADDAPAAADSTRAPAGEDDDATVAGSPHPASTDDRLAARASAQAAEQSRDHWRQILLLLLLLAVVAETWMANRRLSIMREGRA